MKDLKKAVALKYNEEENNAPHVLAKGSGVLAKMIIDKAAKEEIEIVENPDLAEILFEFPEGIEIPEELYKAIADIYVFLYKTHKKYKKVISENEYN